MGPGREEGGTGRTQMAAGPSGVLSSLSPTGRGPCSHCHLSGCLWLGQALSSACPRPFLVGTSSAVRREAEEAVSGKEEAWRSETKPRAWGLLGAGRYPSHWSSLWEAALWEAGVTA